MASLFSPRDFVGVRVKITLKQPDARVLEGTITDVTSNEGVSSLALKEVIFYATNTRFPSWHVSGSHIQDIELVSSNIEPDAVAQHIPAKQDPAIVSFTRPKRPTSNISSTQDRYFSGSEKQIQLVSETPQLVDSKLPNNWREPVEIEGIAISPIPQFSKPAESSLSQLLNRIGDVKDKNELQILHQEIGVLLDHQDGKKDVPKAKGKAAARSKGKVTYKGKGWRDTPILQEINQEDSVQAAGNGKQKQRRKKKVFREEPTGWATEDATDIQTMGAFDFEGSLAKFDKKKVFDQLRKEDLVPHEDRLVGHNKVSRPGTFGGTKLHPTEMVLDGQARTGSAAGRRGSHRTPVIAASSDTDQPDLIAPQRVVPGINPKLSRTNTSTSQRGNSRKKTTIATSVASQDTIPNITPTSSSPIPIIFNGLDKAEEVHLLYQDHTTVCPVVTPGGMAALEKIANTLHNLSPEVSNENAGRTLAEIIMSDLRLPKSARLVSQENLTAMIFVGNHRSGARALVAARHLRARGITCVCCVLGLDRPGHSLDAEVEGQLNMIRTPDTVIASWREVQKYLLHKDENGHHAELWVDAMLATGHGYDTLVPDEQSAVREIVAWINRRPSSIGQRLVFSIDVPCGINASTGEVLIIGENLPLQLRSTHSVCMGAPRTGLLNALQTAWAYSTAHEIPGINVPSNSLLSMKITVVDVGISDAWLIYGESLGLNRGPVVDFGLHWYIRLYIEHASAYNDDDDNGEDADENDDDDR